MGLVFVALLAGSVALIATAIIFPENATFQVKWAFGCIFFFAALMMGLGFGHLSRNKITFYVDILCPDRNSLGMLIFFY